MANMTKILIPPTALFRFALPCQFGKTLWVENDVRLGKNHLLPHCAEIDGRATWAELFAGWNEEGLAFQLNVQGKSKLPRCDASEPAESDGLQLWIDTRDTHNIHRASRFCHRFVFLPSGAGKRGTLPLGGMLPIARARDNPPAPPAGTVKLRSQQSKTGYSLGIWIPAEALTGFNPAEQPRIGFTYAVRDSELGRQVFNCDETLPFDADPSLWATLELVR